MTGGHEEGLSLSYSLTFIQKSFNRKKKSFLNV